VLYIANWPRETNLNKRSDWLVIKLNIENIVSNSTTNKWNCLAATQRSQRVKNRIIRVKGIGRHTPLTQKSPPSSLHCTLSRIFHLASNFPTPFPQDTLHVLDVTSRNFLRGIMFVNLRSFGLTALSVLVAASSVFAQTNTANVHTIPIPCY